MKFDRRVNKIREDKTPSEWMREYLSTIGRSSTNLATSSVSSSNGEITSSSGSLLFNSNGIINFNGFTIDFTDNDENALLVANSQTYASFQPLAWLGYVPGTLIATLRTAAPTGFILAQAGTIGNETSGATVRANRDCQALFIKLWNHYDDSTLPVSGGRGTEAVLDFRASKTITLPTISGRVVACSGSGASLTVRTDYELDGSNSHTITIAEMGSHTHYPITETAGGVQAAGPYTYYGFENSYDITVRKSSSHLEDLPFTGGGSARSNIEETLFINFMIKL